MNDKTVRFQMLVDRARQEAVPSIDVVPRVAERIASVPSPAPSIDWALWSMAGLSAAVAVAVVFVSVQQGALFTDPLADWLRPLVVVMQ